MRTAYLAALLPFLVAANAEAGPYCREYTGTVNVGGHKQESYGTACLQADGSWQIQPQQEQIAEPDVIVIEKPVTRTVVVERPRYRPRYTRVEFVAPIHHHNRHDRYDRYDRRWGRW